MTGPQHYEIAERILDAAGSAANIDPAQHAAWVSEAQAHATLALAAATVDAAAFDRATGPVDPASGWTQHATDVRKDWAEALS